MLLLLKCLKSVDDMIAIGHNTLAYASLGSDDFVELENDMPSEVIVHTRDEWKKQLSSRDLMKALGKAKMIGKEGCFFQPHELMNQCTMVLFHDQRGEFHILELKAV